jgi:hypothetical protein
MHRNHASFVYVYRTIVRYTDRYILGVNRCIDVCAAMSPHCQHSSTARTCAIFASLLLACSEYHELCNHGASQSNYGACLSAGGDKTEFLFSAFANVKMLQFNSS